jgi:hypothetical protein
MEALQRIAERVNRNGDPDDVDTPRPLLTIDEFFDGNTSVGSIGCNLPQAPLPSVFYDLFKRILARDDVADIRVQVTAFDDPDWPFSDTVYIMTTASPEDVASWFDTGFAPDAVSEGFNPGVTYESYVVPAGVRPIGCWWD